MVLFVTGGFKTFTVLRTGELEAHLRGTPRLLGWEKPLTLVGEGDSALCDEKLDIEIIELWLEERSIGLYQ